jgi:predicted XRE-type DNA-binding protein
MKFVRNVCFLGDSLKSLRDFPNDARHDAGYQLDKVQRGDQPDDFKPMPAIGKGVEENAGNVKEGYRYSHKTIWPTAERNDMKTTESYASVWDAIADTPEQAANLRSRAELMQKIAARVKQQGWTQAEAASHCGVTQPRINDLLRGRVSRFSLDALVNIATALGCRVRFDLEAA